MIDFLFIYYHRIHPYDISTFLTNTLCFFLQIHTTQLINPGYYVKEDKFDVIFLGHFKSIMAWHDYLSNDSLSVARNKNIITIHYSTTR